MSGSKSRSKVCESEVPYDAWLRFSGSLKVQNNILTLAAISLVQASMFLEPDWVGAKRSIGGQAITEAEAEKTAFQGGRLFDERAS
jgi:hypothetical protein